MSEISLASRLTAEVLGPESKFVVARTQKRNEWAPIVESARQIVITDGDTKEAAVAHGRLLQASLKSIDELYKAVKQSVDAVKKPILEAEKIDTAAITEAKDALGLKLLVWNKEQDRLHQIALREAQEKARLEEQERKLQEAIALAAEGLKEESESVLNEESMPIPVIVQQSNQKISGEVSKKTYAAEVTSLISLVKSVAEGKTPIQAVLANDKFLNEQARSFREGLSIPGVRIISKDAVHFRA